MHCFSRTLRWAAWIGAFLLIAVLPRPAAAQSFQEYAQRCAFELGDIPQFDCRTGKFLRASRANNGKTCPQLPGPDCVSGSRVGTLSTGKDTTAVFLCRKYRPTRDPFYHDIAIIQHNRLNGKTCWFQTTPDRRVRGNRVPNPNTSRGRRFWRMANNFQTCPACHSASPYIHTPYLAQAVGLFPSGWNTEGAYDPNFQGIFPRSEVGHKFDVTSGDCAGCHAFGGDTAGLVDHVKNFRSMPPGTTAGKSEWNKTYGDDVRLIERCQNSTSASSKCQHYAPLRFCNNKSAKTWVFVFAREEGAGGKSTVYGSWPVKGKSCTDIGMWKGSGIMVHAMNVGKKPMMTKNDLKLCIRYAHHGYRRVKKDGHKCRGKDFLANFARIKRTSSGYRYSLN